LRAIVSASQAESSAVQAEGIAACRFEKQAGATSRKKAVSMVRTFIAIEVSSDADVVDGVVYKYVRQGCPKPDVVLSSRRPLI